MKKEPVNPKPKSTRRHDAARHPVLARLPEVAVQPPAQLEPARAPAAGFVDYRFDLPAGAGEAESRPRLRVPSPAYNRNPPGTPRPLSVARQSRALPASDPFAIPAITLLDRLAPVIRFLTLFLLFTAIGTLVLSTTRQRAAPKRQPVPSAAAPPSVEQRLEPTSNDDHPTIATPKAFGPLGASSGQMPPEPAPAEVTPPSPAGELTVLADRPLSLGGADGAPLPQVQTTENTSTPDGQMTDAMGARFTGRIEASEVSPAENVAQPPAVARRLPAVFDSPRNAYQ